VFGTVFAALRHTGQITAAAPGFVAAHGVRTTDEALAFVANLKKCGRYQQDVY